ncbi:MULTISPECIES: RDD family protein [unclassified Rhodococcus (in: high G+C Gram-positive bacteria)]|jgi:Mce-associated membrane protein|uniref:RDD family protein n=1 Tax=unclassified Rhodococcus (in: high G+C Gram-positive bacteria) TaxID=192944 RepID=UPI0002D647C8|nr:RDD family protein [Rhodococcus sp. DK17]
MTTLNIDTQVNEESAEPERDSAREQGASLVRRARALAIDMCPPVTAAASAGVLSHILAGQVWAVLCWGVVAVSGLGIVANSIIYQGRTGRTAGKYLEGLRTVSTPTGAPIGVLRALIRLGCLPVDGVLFLIGRFWPLHRGQRRTFADTIAGSVVRTYDTEGPTDGRRRLGMTAAAVIPLGAVLLLVLVQFFSQRAADQEIAAAHGSVTQVASDGAVALLSYKPDTVDQDLDAARGVLTGDFLETYTKLAKDVVAPTARDKQVTMQASAAGSAVESVSVDQASVLVYINQSTTTASSPETTQSQNAIRVGLTRVDDTWLISKFEPLF